MVLFIDESSPPGGLERSSSRGADAERSDAEPRPHYASWYPRDPSSIPKETQKLWLERPSTPLVDPDVFSRRRLLATLFPREDATLSDLHERRRRAGSGTATLSDLHVLLVDADKEERFKLKLALEQLGYMVTSAPSGAAAEQLLIEQSGDFHIVMIDSKLLGEGRDCVGLLYWARQQPALKEVAFIVTGCATPPAHLRPSSNCDLRPFSGHISAGPS